MPTKFATACLGLLALIVASPAAASRRPEAAQTFSRAAGMGTDGVECVCHVPPGQPENTQTICVAGRAPRAHLRHGDRLGACDETQRELACDDGLDNDGDSAIDCLDADCVGRPGPDPLGLRGLSRTSTLYSGGGSRWGTRSLTTRDLEDEIGLCEQPETSCEDGFDNDGDGLPDCSDMDCMAAAACDGPAVEICNDALENDGDGLTDCADPECVGEVGPGGATCEQPEVSCADSFDNDGDLASDCADSDCMEVPACAGSGSETCDDGLDNDGDGMIDCADPDCAGQQGPAQEVCQHPEAACGDGFDNDGDNLFDCSDTDCMGTPECSSGGEICNDGQDNDQDQLVDCADGDCDGLNGPGGTCQLVESSCEDQFDNDGDGFTDCADMDCANLYVCDPFREICDDQVDNDFDSLIDCEDPNCSGDPACAP